MQVTRSSRAAECPHTHLAGDAVHHGGPSGQAEVLSALAAIAGEHVAPCRQPIDAVNVVQSEL